LNIKSNKKPIDFIYFLCYNYPHHKKLIKIFLIIKGSSYNHSINITKFISGTVTIIGNKTFGMNIFHIKSFFYVYKVLTKRRREMKHFTKSKKQLFDEFETVSTGLTNEEVEKRRKKYGENKFIENLFQSI